MKTRVPVIAVLALAGALSAGTASAQRHDDIQWSVTIGSPSVVPAYPRDPGYRPAPTVLPAPRAVYVPAPVRVGYRQPTRWDVDGDGIPNRVDRVYNPAWDVDGDGIPNWRDRDNRRAGGPAYRDHRDADRDGIPDRVDRVYNPAWDRDGDGIPNRRDGRPDVPQRGYGR